ncbi:hypothetical protein BH09VER1_BH09VER1_27730 [soil metagenome]
MNSPSPILRKRGVALVLVLAVVVLITALIVGFLLRVGSDRSSTASYSSSVAARQLGDVVVNLVQGQINDATSQGAGTAWASQPGAVRVYDSTGGMKTLYRLYSASALTTSQASDLANDVPPATWSGSPALWVDLNAPVTVQGVKDSSGSTVKSYPILDPRDPADPTKTVAIEGFAVNSAPGATASQPAPMPVRWLYVLKNGQIVSPDASSTGSIATFASSATVPSAANPIVGRVAFWTDDETCKVNVNTAAGSMRVDPSGITGADGSPAVLPAPWDTPRLKIWDELRLFSQDQPVHYEYQRYPGHPATTDLYSIFHPLGIPMTGYPYASTGYNTTGAKTAAAANNPSNLFKLLPRYGDAFSSSAGTANTTATQPAPAAVLNSDRLYTSFGEMMYDQQRTTTGITRQQIEAGKFFLTSSSRAPDVTLFGTPRISMWPIDSDYGVNPTASNSTKLTSPFDKLIAFCTSTGAGSTPRQYYIQRHDSTSPTNDFTNILRNRNLYFYLQNLTSATVPGFGGSFAGKYGTSSNTGERDQILTEMVDYIRSTNVYDHANPGSTDPRFTPGYSATFNGFGQVVPLQIGTTQGLGRNYTISEVGLQVICTADGNSAFPYQDPVSVSGTLTSPVKGSANDYRYVSNLPVAQMLRNSGSIPNGLVPPTTYASQTTSAYVGTARDNSPTGSNLFPPNPTLANTYGGALTRLSPGQKRLQAMLIFEIQCPTQGYDNIFPNLQVRVSEMNKLSIAGTSPFDSTYPLLTSSVNRTNSWTSSGGYQQFSMSIFSGAAGGSNQRPNGWSGIANSGTVALPPVYAFSPPGSANTKSYWFVSNPFTVADDDSGSATMGISGGPFKIELLSTPKGGGTPVTVQTFNVTFPATTPPMPDLMQYGMTAKNSAGTYNFTSAADWWGFDNRISWAASQISTSSPTASSNLYLGSIMRADPAGTTPSSTAGSWTYMKGSEIATPYYKGPDGNAGPSQPSDVVRTLIAKDGDTRLVMAKSVVDSSAGDMVPTAGYSTSVKLADNFVCDAGFKYHAAGSDMGGKLVPGVTYPAYLAPKIPSNVTPNKYWDWDTGLPTSIDGAYANKPDEGNIYVNSANPYYQSGDNFDGNDVASQTKRSSYFTANRIIPSAVMFGSLPTGVKNNISWRTLLFRPLGADDTFHPSSGPADHLFLDLFTMPVVEPYAISEPFSTAGKVNMNYQIVPFTYITRSSALRAVLSSELIARAPAAAAVADAYKGQPGAPASSLSGAAALMGRLPLNLDDSNGTLKQFADKFSSGQIFRSASEICDLYLVPKGYTWPAFASQWYDYAGDFAMVGDNVRERPYADIYPRLTTKSNTYTVHYTVQALKNLSSDPSQWSETRGAVIGEYRGSTTIERFLDPNNSSIPDYADGGDPTAKDPLDKFYQWRIVANRRFYP